MKIMNSRLKKIIMTKLAVFAIAAMSIGNVTPIQAADMYKVSFKAGAKGSFNGTSSIDVNVPYKGGIDVDLYESFVDADTGYYFIGWSPDAKGEVEVTKKTIFVAQYAKVIDEAVYRVNYVDTYGNAVATQKVVTTNDGARVSETALPIADYAVDATVKTAVVNKNGTTDITFIYTSTLDPNVIIDTESIVLPGGTTITVVAGGTDATVAGGTVADTAEAAGETPEPAVEEPAGETVENPDEEVPLDNPDASDDDEVVKSEDEEVPLANQDASSNTWVYGVAGVILLIAMTGAIYAYARRKKS